MGNTAPLPQFGKKTTSDEIGEKLGGYGANKYVVVTGGNSGLGLETARVLSLRGAHVVIACRSEKNGSEAVAKITKDIPDAKVSFMQLDLGSFPSIRKFAADYKALNIPLHILINNAGVMACPLTRTSEGLEMQFGTNHIGHFLLTTELLDLIKSSGVPEYPARIINLSSVGQYYFAPPQGMRLDDLGAEKHYDQWERYGSSKLANILFTKHLQALFAAENANVVAVSVHPGVIGETNLSRHLDLRSILNIIGQVAPKGVGALYSFLAADNKNIKQGSATTLYCALCPDIVNKSGAHFADCAEETFYLHPTATDPKLAEALWKASEEIVNKT